MATTEPSWTKRLSVMDARMQSYSIRLLYIFPPQPSDSSIDSSSAGDSPTANIDVGRLERSFYEMIRADYAFVLDGELRTEIATGGVMLCAADCSSDPAVSSSESAAYEPLFEVAPTASSLTTHDAVATRAFALVPARLPHRLLAVLCTLLADGGFAIGLNVHHCVLDADGCFALVTQWSRHYCDVPAAKRRVICHDRSPLFARGQPVIYDHPEYSVVSQSPAPTTPLATPFPATTQRVFHLQHKQLASLKAFVMSGLRSDTNTTPSTSISSLDALTALLVLLITRARGHGADVNVGTAVNGRRRFEPPLPPYYAGNAVFTAFSTIRAHELSGGAGSTNSVVQNEQVAAVAQRIRASIARQTSAFMRDTIEFLTTHMQQNESRVEATTQFFFGTDVMVSSWRGLGCLDADFDGARPLCVTPVALPVCDGLVVLLESAADGDGGADAVDALVYLEIEAMARLESLWSRAAAQCWLTG